MNLELLDILACPIDKHHPLDAHFFTWVTPAEVESGILFCPACGRWYPIGNKVKTVPELYPDFLRDREQETKWFNEWRHLIPENIKLQWEDR